MEQYFLLFASKVKEPILLAALFAVILFFIFKQVLAKNIFPSLTKAGSFVIIKTIIDRLFILSLIAALLGFAGYIFPLLTESRTSDAEESVLSLEKDVSNLQVAYEQITSFDEPSTYKDMVEKKAGKLLNQVLNIQDKELRLSVRFIKYETALMASVYAASVAIDANAKTKYANMAIESANRALMIRDDIVRKAASGDKEYQDIQRRWFDDNDKIELVYYYLAGAYVLKIMMGEGNMVNKARDVMTKEISEAYRRKYPFEDEKILKWFLENYGLAPN